MAMKQGTSGWTRLAPSKVDTHPSIPKPPTFADISTPSGAGKKFHACIELKIAVWSTLGTGSMVESSLAIHTLENGRSGQASRSRASYDIQLSRYGDSISVSPSEYSRKNRAGAMAKTSSSRENVLRSPPSGETRHTGQFKRFRKRFES